MHARLWWQQQQPKSKTPVTVGSVPPLRTATSVASSPSSSTPSPSTPNTRLSLFHTSLFLGPRSSLPSSSPSLNSVCGTSAAGYSGHRKSICEPIHEEPSPIAESSDLAVRAEDLEIYKRHHRPLSRPHPSSRSPSAPSQLISTNTTKPVHINHTRYIDSSSTTTTASHSRSTQQQHTISSSHGLTHAKKRISTSARSKSNGLQDCHHRRRCQSHAQRDQQSRQDSHRS